MAAAATPSIVTVTGVAAVMAGMPFGVPNLTMFLGGACFFAGCCARTASVMYGKLNGNEPVSMEFFARQFAMLLCCVPLSAVASGALFLGAKTAGIDGHDTALNGLLLILGVRGPEGFAWLMDKMGGIFERFAPQKPGDKP